MNVRPAPTGYALVIDSTGERHTIGRKLVIGRESAEIAVDDLEVSRRHATIRPLDDGGLELYDLDSANGTFVNDVRVGSQPLRLRYWMFSKCTFCWPPMRARRSSSTD